MPEVIDSTRFYKCRMKDLSKPFRFCWPDDESETQRRRVNSEHFNLRVCRCRKRASYLTGWSQSRSYH